MNAPFDRETTVLALLRALQYAATFDFPVWLRPFDAWLENLGVAHDGRVPERREHLALALEAIGLGPGVGSE